MVIDLDGKEVEDSDSSVKNTSDNKSISINKDKSEFLELE